MRRILIPTDFSDNAMNALKYALECFKYEICEFYFMHAYEDEIYSDVELLRNSTFETVLNSVRDRTEDYLQSFLQAAQSLAPNPRYTYHTIAAYNSLIDEADKLVNSENMDLVIMGTRGETNDPKLTFGSHTLQVLKYVQCPVLAIPENYKYTQPKHILFPTDFMIPKKRRELKLLCELAAPFRAEIDLLYVSKYSKLSLRQEHNRDFIMTELKKNKVNFKTADDKHIVDAIYKHIKENKIDLLVMVNTRHSFLENILFQSKIDKMSLHLEIPFLALQNMERS